MYEAAMYGVTQIRETDSYKHLGIVQSRNGKHPYDIDAVTRTIRGTFLSLAGTVSGRAGPNPGTAMKLYYRSVLPHSVFGCELWNDISKSDIHQLEIAHHFCLKRAQGLPHLTRSDMVTGLVGAASLEACIDLQKLSFFGQLCRTQANKLSRQLMLCRLYQFKLCTSQKLGFIPDLARILEKYALLPFLWSPTEPTFPSKYAWKRMCKTAVHKHEELAWTERMNTSAYFNMYKQVHPYLRESSIWSVARVRPECLSLLKLLAYLCYQRPPEQLTECHACSKS